jgi:hypothetical protein
MNSPFLRGCPANQIIAKYLGIERDKQFGSQKAANMFSRSLSVMGDGYNRRMSVLNLPRYLPANF